VAALEDADFEILVRGFAARDSPDDGVGGRAWQDAFLAANPVGRREAVRSFLGRTSTSGGRGTVVARRVRPQESVYVAVSVSRFSRRVVNTLLDVVEVEAVEPRAPVADARFLAEQLDGRGRCVLAGLVFDEGRATLRPASREALAVAAKVLHARPMQRFLLVGHGKDAELWQARAHAVAGALVEEHGVDSARLEAAGGTSAGPPEDDGIELVRR